MPYPTISRAAARSFLKMRFEFPESVVEPEVTSKTAGGDQDWDQLADEIAAKLYAFKDKLPPLTKSNEVGSTFDAEAAELVHMTLPTHPALVDGEFWAWLAITRFIPLILWRYPPKPGKEVNLDNFGVGNARENLLYRLWLRAEMVVEPGAPDPYHLAKRGDVDFWRSHLFRQTYADAPNFARALLKFQFPEAKGEPRLRTENGIRPLARHLKRARTNLRVELMSEERAAAYIEAEWSKLKETLAKQGHT